MLGVLLVFIVAQAAPALALSNDRDDRDGDGFTNSIEHNVTETNPRCADTNNDRIKYGNEDEDKESVDNTNELSLATDLDGKDSDDGLENDDEDDDGD